MVLVTTHPSTEQATGWLSPAQAAQILGCTPNRVRQLADSGVLQQVRTPLGRLLVESSVEELRRQRAAAGRVSRGS